MDEFKTETMPAAYTFPEPGSGFIEAPGINAVVTQRALEDSNPRHRVLETRVLPTELRTHGAVEADASNGRSEPPLSYLIGRSKRCFKRVALPTRSRR